MPKEVIKKIPKDGKLYLGGWCVRILRIAHNGEFIVGVTQPDLVVVPVHGCENSGLDSAKPGSDTVGD
jgi:hypothetical protein